MNQFFPDPTITRHKKPGVGTWVKVTFIQPIDVTLAWRIERIVGQECQRAGCRLRHFYADRIGNPHLVNYLNVRTDHVIGADMLSFVQGVFGPGMHVQLQRALTTTA